MENNLIKNKPSIYNIHSFLEKTKKYTFLEIGARYGDSAEFILKNYNIKEYIIIDPYEQYENYKQDGFNNVLKNKELQIFENTKKRLSKYNVKFIKKFSDNAHDLIKDNSIDVCFIDGNHTYEYVLRDIKNYFPKIKNGGIICGDDYFMRHKDIVPLGNKAGYDEKMVYEAVQDYFKNTDYKIKELGKHRGFPKTWLVIK